MPPKKSKGRPKGKPLPLVIRQSRTVFPLLREWGLYQRKMLGDGNCLFASLSDQLYSTPKKHPEIRKRIVEWMRENRLDFEAWCIPEDMQSKRPLRTRSTATSTSRRRTPTPDDPFEAYLTQMATDATFGGHAELLAFCQAWDRDIIIHRPEGQAQLLQQIDNTLPSKGSERKYVHVSFGDEDRRPHYDSIRNIDPSKPDLPGPISKLAAAGEKTGYKKAELRHSRGMGKAGHGLTSEQIQDLLIQGRADLDQGLRSLIQEDRARSSSRSSSQHSASSGKRSLDDDGETHRARKRPDRRISLRNRTIALVSPIEKVPEIPFQLRLGSSGPLTPSSDAPESSVDQDESTPSQTSDVTDPADSVDQPVFSQKTEDDKDDDSVDPAVDIDPGGTLPKIRTSPKPPLTRHV